jgi:acyl-CoA reductase-like NAD-dependent aldehyde dehydrogenase
MAEQSGIGREQGRAIEHYLETKTVMIRYS